MIAPSIDQAIRTAVREEVAAAIAQALPRIAAPTPKKMLTVPQLVAAYGIGRGQILGLIAAGTLPAVSAVMRGGRQGWRVRADDADRVLAGARP